MRAATAARHGRGLDRRDGEVPARRAGREKPPGRANVDEPRDATSEPARKEPRELDLEPAGEDHLPPADDTCLQTRVAEAERDDE